MDTFLYDDGIGGGGGLVREARSECDGGGGGSKATRFAFSGDAGVGKDRTVVRLLFFSFFAFIKVTHIKKRLCHQAEKVKATNVQK